MEFLRHFSLMKYNADRDLRSWRSFPVLFYIMFNFRSVSDPIPVFLDNMWPSYLLPGSITRTVHGKGDFTCMGNMSIIQRY